MIFLQWEKSGTKIVHGYNVRLILKIFLNIIIKYMFIVNVITKMIVIMIGTTAKLLPWKLPKKVNSYD